MVNCRAQKNKGFTLLEVSIVLVLMSFVTIGGLVILTASVQKSQTDATLAKIQTIETALLNFRLAQNRLPCPAQLSLASSSTSYALEAGATTGGTGTGECKTGMTPAADFEATNGTSAIQANAIAAEGAIPTRALQLPDDYMFDAWGNHFRYVVDVGTTATNAFLSLPHSSLTPCGPITVNDSTGTARSAVATYAIVSHGVNGHGAYTRSGSTRNYGSTNTDEQTNCHCNSSATSTGYPGTGFTVPTYVQKLLTLSSSSGLNNFDDIVSYKERWQLQSVADSNPAAAVSSGLDLFVGGGATMVLAPYYQQTSTTYTAVTTVTSSCNVINAMAMSPDNTVIAIASTSNTGCNALRTYTMNSTGLTLYKYAQINATSNGVAFSGDGRLLAFTFSVSPYLYLFQPTALAASGLGSSFSPSTLPTSAGGVVTFSTDSKYLAMAESSSPYLLVYNINCTTLTPVTSAPAPGAAVKSLSFSENAKYLAVVSGTNTLTIYKNAAGSFTSVATPVPAGTTYKSAAFSHNGNYLAVVTNTSPYLYFYTNNRDDSFTAFSSGVSGGAGANAAWVSWSSDDKYVAVANGSADTDGNGKSWNGVALYQLNGATVTPLSALSSPPAQNMTSVVFRN